MKKKLEIQKQKQELLNKQIQEQKVTSWKQYNCHYWHVTYADYTVTFLLPINIHCKWNPQSVLTLIPYRLPLTPYLCLAHTPYHVPLTPHLLPLTWSLILHLLLVNYGSIAPMAKKNL